MCSGFETLSHVPSKLSGNTVPVSSRRVIQFSVGAGNVLRLVSCRLDSSRLVWSVVSISSFSLPSVVPEQDQKRLGLQSEPQTARRKFEQSPDRHGVLNNATRRDATRRQLSLTRCHDDVLVPELFV